MEQRGGIAVETDVPGEAGPITRVSYQSRPGVVAVVAEFPTGAKDAEWEDRLRAEIRNAKRLREAFLATKAKADGRGQTVRRLLDEEVGPEQPQTR